MIIMPNFITIFIIFYDNATTSCVISHFHICINTLTYRNITITSFNYLIESSISNYMIKFFPHNITIFIVFDNHSFSSTFIFFFFAKFTTTNSDITITYRNNRIKSSINATFIHFFK